MSQQSVISTRRGPALWVTINRPEVRNAINPEVTGSLLDEVASAARDEEVRAVVITGAGDRAFCAGGDVGGADFSGGPVHAHLRRSVFAELLKAIRGSPLPVLARVNGAALGGGFGLALGCDLVIAAEHAQFGTPEINLGLWPYIITALIQRHLAPKRALEMMMLGRRLSAAEAAAAGLVNRVVSGAELDSATDALVEELAAKSPLVLRVGKQSFYAASDLVFDSALAYLEGQLTLGLQAEDAAEGISAFLQKRPPEWRGR